jgi:amidophosphoribosyltransferase
VSRPFRRARRRARSRTRVSPPCAAPPPPPPLTTRSIVLVDDSLVRGNTLRQLVPLLRRGGAREVHVRISSPPIRHPCHYGVDIGSYEELITSHMSTTEAIREYIGADSLAYLSQEGMIAAVEGGQGGSGHCHGCFDGQYPIAHEGAGRPQVAN